VVADGKCIHYKGSSKGCLTLEAALKLSGDLVSYDSVR
jgi:hypothetical protein